MPKLMLYLLCCNSIAVTINFELPCLTWTRKRDVLSLTCQLKDFSSTVLFKDRKERIKGFCDFKTPCTNIEVDMTSKIVTLKLDTNKVKDIEGKWSCVQGNETFSSYVSRDKDTTELSYLQVDGRVISRNTTKMLIEITCSTCRKPIDNGIEYLLNGITYDTVFYNPNTKTCRHQLGPCINKTCSCLLGGHRISRLFDVDSFEFSISCLVTLKDGSRSFYRNSTIQLDGNNFTDVDSVDIPWTSTSNPSKTNAFDRISFLDVMNNSPPALLLIIFLVMGFIKLYTKKCRQISKLKSTMFYPLSTIFFTVMCAVGVIVATTVKPIQLATVIIQIICLISATVGCIVSFKTDITEIIFWSIIVITMTIYYPVQSYVQFKYTGIIALTFIIIAVCVFFIKQLMTRHSCECKGREMEYSEELADLSTNEIGKEIENSEELADLSTNDKEKTVPKFDEWMKDDETFIVTRATRYVQTLIEDEDIVTVTGDSGTGKSSLIHHVALHLRGEYDIIPNVTCPGDIIRNRNMQKAQVFVIDDVCGKNSINEQSLHEWLEFDDEFKQERNASNTAKIKILITCRLQIFDNPRFQTLKIFTDNVCNLQYDDHCLLPAERRNIFECHLPGYALQDLKQFLSKNEYVETLDDLFGKFHFFPLLCKLSHGKTSEQLNALFTTPVESITSDIKLSIRYWSFNYHALVFCCMFQTGFDEGCIDNPNEKQKIDDILSSLEISLEEEKTRQMLRKAFDLLDGKFLQKKGSKYFIIHDKVFDIISNIWIKELPKLFAKNTTF